MNDDNAMQINITITLRRTRDDGPPNPGASASAEGTARYASVPSGDTLRLTHARAAPVVELSPSEYRVIRR